VSKERKTPVAHLSGPYKVQVLDRAVALLEILSLSPSEMSLGELTTAVGLHKSTVHRLLMVLEAHRLVEKSPINGHYRLGLKLFELGGASISRLNLGERIRPQLEWLTHQTGESVYLGLFDRGEVLCLDFTEPPRAPSILRPLGSRFSAHCTAAGKAVLSHFPDEVISRILRRHGMAPATPTSIRTEAEFLAEVALTRQRGYALSDEEFVEGLRSIALPFRLADANSPAAIAVVGPTSRFTDEKRLAALEALRIVVEETTRVQDNSKTDSRPNGVGRKNY